MFFRALVIYQALFQEKMRLIIWAPFRENLSSGFPTLQDSNQSAQLQGLARILRYCVEQNWLLFFPDSE